ncbi:MAG: SMP-30/gluconolactonase/LRE family protein [Granulosicoccus sp.]
MSAITIECVLNIHSKLGEGAVWDSASQRLWWVDITAGLIHAFDPSSGNNQTWDWGEPVGCMAVRESGGLLLATRTGFHFFDPETGQREALSNPESGAPSRFNDGTTDTEGRFWAGTMKAGGEPEKIGRFYRFDKNHQTVAFFDNVFTTNGLAFSPDGRTLYFSDSNPAVRTIWCCDYDPDSGHPGTPRVFFDTCQVEGRPDGGTVDADGCYWMAGVSGWQLVRITPQGKVDRIVNMPIEKPTKPMFGGNNLDVLYVTSIGGDTSTGLAEGQPLAGGLFAVTGLGVKGVEQTRFAG